MNESYNGWTNYETWLVVVWMDNDADMHDLYYNEYAVECTGTSDLADKIRDTIEEAACENTGNSGLMCDLMNSAICRVNFYEIAEHILGDEY